MPNGDETKGRASRIRGIAANMARSSPPLELDELETPEPEEEVIAEPDPNAQPPTGGAPPPDNAPPAPKPAPAATVVPQVPPAIPPKTQPPPAPPPSAQINTAPATDKPSRKININLTDPNAIALLAYLEQLLEGSRSAQRLKGQLGATILLKMGLVKLAEITPEELYELARRCYKIAVPGETSTNE